MASPSSTIVLITGANQGLGLAIAKKLATEYPSYHILLGSRSPEKGAFAAAPLQAAGLSITPVTIDVTSDASIATCFNDISSTHGRLDVLINNAGIAPKEETSLRTMMALVADTNAIGAAVVTDTFIPLLEKSALPRVVFMSSELGCMADETRKDELLPYKASKAMMNKICMFYAKKFAEKGWKVNACCPGWVGTNLNGYRGIGTVEEGSVNAVRLATLGADGETGTFSNKEGVLGW